MAARIINDKNNCSITMGTFNGIRGNPKKTMSDKEKEYLLNNHSTHTLAQLARHLKVSDYKVQCWLKELEIEKPRVRSANKERLCRRSEYFEHDKDLVTI